MHAFTNVQACGHVALNLRVVVKLLSEHINHRNLIPSGSPSLGNGHAELQMPLDIHTCTQSINGGSLF